MIRYWLTIHCFSWQSHSQHWTIQRKNKWTRNRGTQAFLPLTHTHLTGPQGSRWLKELKRAKGQRNGTIHEALTHKPLLPLYHMPLITAQMTGQVPTALHGRAVRGQSSEETHTDPWQTSESLCGRERLC